jgi:hypothetical protein
MSVDARTRLCGHLTAIGFASVTMLDPAQPPPDIQTGPREAA